MQASQLLLDQYHLEELRFSLDDDYKFGELEIEPTLRAEDLHVEVQPFQKPDDPLQWFLKLSVSLDEKDGIDEKGGRFPYSFSIRLAGFFEVSKDCPLELIEPLALINAPSILYAAAREILAITTARSRYLSVFLPSVRFYGPTPEVSKESGAGIPSAIKTNKPRRTKSQKVGRKK